MKNVRIVAVVGLIFGLVAGASPAAAEHASGPAGTSRVDAGRVNLGDGTACVILDNGNARCWGNNNQGQTGTGVANTTLGRDETPDTLPTLQLGEGRTVLGLDTGSRHGCAVLDDGAVRCWGRNPQGQLGVPGAVSTGYNGVPTENPPVQVGGDAIAVATGSLSSCVILTGGAVRCWGEGGKGVNGQGDEVDLGIAVSPGSVPPIALGGPATAITVGRSHACVILQSGFVRCWGEGAAQPLQPPGPVPQDIGDDEAPTASAAFDLGGEEAVAISAGASSTCGINESGDLYCWGGGVINSFGLGGTPEEPTQVDLGGASALAVDLGELHACVVLTDGSVRCWGRADNGRLGYGDAEDIGDDEAPTAGGPVALGAGRTAKAVSAGLRATCVLLDNDTVRCWGDADEIGSGQPLDIGDDELPTAIPPVNYIGTAAYEPLTPARILDTRPGETAPAGSHKGFVPGGGSIDVAVTDVGGVPADDVYAVVLNVTITQSGGPGFVTAYPKGVAQPNASNINVVGAGETAPNLVIVPVGADGEVTLAIGGPGGGHLIADVLGYYEQRSSSTSGRLIGVTPARVFDTRPGEPAPGPKGKIPAEGTIEVKMTGDNGVPESGVSAVVINLTGTEAAAPGFVTAYPGDVAQRPGTSNVNLVAAGATRANSVIVPVSPTGTVKFYALSSTHLLADITGYYTDDSAEDTDDGLFVPLQPARLLDTRTGGGSPVGVGGMTDFEVTGRLGIPSTANAVVLNLTATETGGIGFVTGWPSDQSRPGTSNVNYLVANTTIANLAILPLTMPSGSISLYTLNSSHLIADTSGYHL